MGHFTRMLKILVLSVSVQIYCFSADALSLREDFSTTTQFNSSSSTLVWNIYLGVLHPSLFVDNWQQTGVSPQTDTAFSVGTGRYGAFNSSTYANFSQGGNVAGNIIRLDTDSITSLDVTDFVLDSGWTLQPVGSQPLIIRSQNDVLINGVIDCSGQNGSDIASNYTSTVAGASGRCGGGTGGNGASQTISATAGTPTAGSVKGGGEGFVNIGATTGAGGGGGGAYSGSTATAGNDPNARGGSGILGSSTVDDAFTTIGGGGGGGGGGLYFNGAGDTDDSHGASGGGGGGVVLIYAVRDVTISAPNGLVKATGGTGGTSSGTLKAGLGGGGGGGSILIFAGRNYVNNVVGGVIANGGAGGTRGGGNGNGGNGGTGRVWVTDNDATPAGAGNEQPSSSLFNYGTVVYTTGSAQVAETNSYDLQNTSPAPSALTATSTLQGGSTLTLQAAGSSDNFASDNTGWTSTLSSLSGKRYIKFRAQLTNTAVANPSIVDYITLSYDGRIQTQFNFKGACGTVRTPNGTNELLNWILLLAMLALARLRLWRSRGFRNLLPRINL